jgi:hypothetical protein
VLSAPLDTNHYAFLNLENAATKVCPLLNQPIITACSSVKVQPYKMFQALFLIAANLFLKNTATIVAISNNSRATQEINSGMHALTNRSILLKTLFYMTKN